MCLSQVERDLGCDQAACSQRQQNWFNLNVNAHIAAMLPPLACVLDSRNVYVQLK